MVTMNYSTVWPSPRAEGEKRDVQTDSIQNELWVGRLIFLKGSAVQVLNISGILSTQKLEVEICLRDYLVQWSLNQAQGSLNFDNML